MTRTSNKYQNFDVAIYCRAYEVQKMQDLDWLSQRYETLRRCVKANKIYLETHRDLLIANEATVRQARAFFEERGMQVAGGITLTVNEMNRFETFCYTRPEHRQKVREIVEYTAGLFDEVILDDFFFTNCKCPSCVAAKGEQRWTDFRLELMAGAARDLVLEPARAVNPRVKMVVKYPNWYQHFQGLGFNLEVEPPLFDGIYTGTETRDPVFSNQHLQPYHGYSIFRYFENIKPGGNGGGWVDPFGSHYADRYAEQLWLTLFAKAPEVTLFDFRAFDRLVTENDRAPWQAEQPGQEDGQPVRFDFAAATAPFRQPDGSLGPGASYALLAGWAFEQVDRFYEQLGHPLGLPVYRPYHSTGEDFLPSYLGMLGIPVDLVPEFPTGAEMVLLTEDARRDPQIVEKIKARLLEGGSVTITSGLLRALQERGIRDVAELEHTGRIAAVTRFLIGWGQVYTAEKPVTVPQIAYLTNDSWEEISCNAGVTGSPLLHSAQYGRGVLYVLTIPEAFGDLYHLPREVLNRIRQTLTRGLYVRLDAPAQVALFVYDNDTFIVESFLDEVVEVGVVLDERFGGVTDLLTGQNFPGEDILDWRKQPIGQRTYRLPLSPHSFRVLRAG